MNLPAGVFEYNNFIDEAEAIQDTLSSTGLILYEEVDESVSATETLSVLANYVDSIAESLTPEDAYVAVANLVAVAAGSVLSKYWVWSSSNKPLNEPWSV